MSGAAPDITIVVPAWGSHVEYLPEAVRSLQEQAGPATKIVVVDNASDVPVPPLPAGVEVVRTESRFRVGAARNVGLERADTPYVMFWDADDLMLPGALARMHAVIDDDPAVVATTMDSVQWAPSTGPGDRWPWPRSAMYRLSRRRRTFALVAQLYNPFTTTGPALMRTDEARDAGGFAADIAFYEDWALAASLTVRGRIVMLRDIGRLYRVHPDSLSLGHLGHPDVPLWLRGLRRRMLRDPRSPLWLKAAVPVIYLQHVHRARRAKRPDTGIGFYESALEEIDQS